MGKGKQASRERQVGKQVGQSKRERKRKEKQANKLGKTGKHISRSRQAAKAGQASR